MVIKNAYEKTLSLLVRAIRMVNDARELGNMVNDSQSTVGDFSPQQYRINQAHVQVPKMPEEHASRSTIAPEIRAKF